MSRALSAARTAMDPLVLSPSKHVLSLVEGYEQTLRLRPRCSQATLPSPFDKLRVSGSHTIMPRLADG